jgi:hypothetical protein
MNEELEQIVQKMMDSGESEESIREVILAYNQSETTKKKVSSQEPTQPQEQPTPPSVESGQGVNQVGNTQKEATTPESRQLATPENIDEYSVDNILSPEVQAIKKDEKENPYKYLLQNKSVTPKETLDSLSKEIEETNRQIDNTPPFNPVSTGMRDTPINQEVVEQQRKRQELIQKKKSIKNQIVKLESDNIDIANYNSGYTYKIDDNFYTTTEFLRMMQTNDMQDKLSKGEDANISVEIQGDSNMMDFVALQKEAAQRGFGDKAISGFSATVEGIVSGVKIKQAEAASLFTDAEGVASFLMATNPRDVTGNLIAIKALNSAKKEYTKDDDIQDSFLRNYAKGLSEQQDYIRGAIYIKEEDAIDRFMDGDILGGIKESTLMAIESAPYMATAMIPYVGTALVANSVQSQKYYEYRNNGVEQGKALALSGLSAAVERADALVGKFLIGASLKSAKRIADGAGKNLGFNKEATTQLFKDIAKPFYTEAPTEFAQESASAIIDQVAYNEDIDLIKAGRQGLLGSLAAMPTATVIASPVALTSVYSLHQGEQRKNKVLKAIENIVFEMPKIENESDIRVLRKEAQNLMTEYINIMDDAKGVAENANKEQTSQLKSLTVAEISLEKALNNNSLTKDTKDALQERLDRVRQDKDAIISEVKKTTEAKPKTETVSEQKTTPTESGAEVTQESQSSVGNENVSGLSQRLKTPRIARVAETLDKVFSGKNVNINEIENAQKTLLDELDANEKSNASSRIKAQVAREIENLFNQLDNYENTTETKTRTVTKKTPIRVPRESKREQAKNPQERLIGRKINRVEGDILPDFEYTQTEGQTTVIEEQDGKLVIQEFDKDGNRTTAQELSTNNINDFELFETLKDDSGNVIGATLKNKNNDAEVFSFMDEDLALDFAVEKTKAEVGELTFEEEVILEQYEQKINRDDTKKGNDQQDNQQQYTPTQELQASVGATPTESGAETNQESQAMVAAVSDTKKAIQSEAKAVREAKKSLNQARKDIIARLSEMETQGRIPAKRVKSMIAKVNAVNLENQDRVDALVDFIERQFDVAKAREERLEGKERARTRKKVKGKLKELGALKNLQQPIINLLSIPTDILPKKALEVYDKVTKELARAGTKYFKENRSKVIKEINAANNLIQNDINSANELINGEKNIKEEFRDTEDFYKTIERLIDEGIITDEQAETIERYRDYFELESKDSTTDSNDRLQEFTDASDALKVSYEVDFNDFEKEAVKEAKTITEAEFNAMPAHAQRELVRGMEMASLGFVSSKLLGGVNRVMWQRNMDSIPLNEIKPNGRIDTMRAKVWQGVKNLFTPRTKRKDFTSEKIKSAPKFNMDEVFKVDDKMTDLERLFNKQAKDFKSTYIYEKIFRPLAIPFDKAEVELRTVKNKLTKVVDLLSSTKNTAFKQKAKIMLYHIQKEFKTNPDNNEVTSALDWFEATLNDPDSVYDKEGKAMISEVAKEFTVNGEISISKIEKSFSTKEKRAERLIRSVYDSLSDKAEADAVFQGLPFVKRNNYVHLPRLKKTDKGDQMAESIEELSNTFKNPSVKSKNVLQRTGRAHAISFDPIHNAFGAAKQTILSYHMNPKIKGAAIGFKYLEKKFAGKEDQLAIIASLKESMNNVIESEYGRVKDSTLLVESLLKGIPRAGYYAMLAGVVRASVEFTFNAMHTVGLYSGQFMSGVTIVKGIDKGVMDAAIKQTNSTQASRITGDAELSSKDVEANLIKQRDFFETQQPASKVGNIISPVTKAGKGFTDKLFSVSDWLVQRPDTSIARPLFVGLFNEKFKEVTGSDVDWNKLANDKNYRNENKDAIGKASEYADNGVVTSVASKNPFEGIEKNLRDKDASGVKRAFQMMNRFMTTFRVFEYYSAVRGVQGLMGSGKITRAQGAMLLAMTVSRMAMYKLGIDMISGLVFSGVAQAMDWDDEDKETLADEVIGEIPNSVLGTVVTLALGRNIGNVGNMLTNWGVEYANKNYGEGITWDGEFDPYKDAVMFNKIPLDLDEVHNPHKKYMDMIISNTGAYSPLADATLDGLNAAYMSQTVKTKKTKKKYEDELYYMIPFRIAGSLGLIPAYRDFKKIAQKRFYQVHGTKKKK